MPLPVEALSMLPTLAAGPSVSLAPVAAAAAPIALGAITATGVKMLPKLWESLQAAKAGGRRLQEAGQFANLAENAANINDTLSYDTLRAFDMVGQKYQDPSVSEALQTLDPWEQGRIFNETAYDGVNPYIAYEEEPFSIRPDDIPIGSSPKAAKFIGFTGPSQRPYDPTRTYYYGEADPQAVHKNTALGRWFAQHNFGYVPENFGLSEPDRFLYDYPRILPSPTAQAKMNFEKELMRSPWYKDYHDVGWE